MINNLRPLVYLLGCFHIICTTLYLLPINPLSKSYSPIVIPYMSQFFSQNWELFGRNLTKNSTAILYKCNEREEWRLYGYSVLWAHHRTRFIKNLRKTRYISAEI